ncbi:hypothetical protein PHYBLDRAFT_173259 [Phycomyces blakesleeanus NRRL 1555(-)]|uniref:Uncharacterized protein n=1 Tax=Phycomyces blakesleeanus (strain ATCC 8743b / DSM 1359 / FGSC 10004 / NBRC 33097 / NRRL 1555) TaxID=763407 RepID=A0A162ZPJ7_PHYB8|nr:hypothetical protein PHYBLDRAFT_173259 [Phycomyces blakesleeanus NRRL 1555(-)]OAD68251.1 hypothetical protein PHYBLDRAFT_173259 [Phycomyces blakesleeanus NRRL 1555(-)]|eukprot:XP_018286291.1 hypothetical protein PHYBLDRAFT_173259 [Phycomyces blakesleeanus NRRL 1555(-)]
MFSIPLQTFTYGESYVYVFLSALLKCTKINSELDIVILVDSNFITITTSKNSDNKQARAQIFQKIITISRLSLYRISLYRDLTILYWPIIRKNYLNPDRKLSICTPLFASSVCFLLKWCKFPEFQGSMLFESEKIGYFDQHSSNCNIINLEEVDHNVSHQVT